MAPRVFHVAERVLAGRGERETKRLLFIDHMGEHYSLFYHTPHFGDEAQAVHGDRRLEDPHVSTPSHNETAHDESKYDDRDSNGSRDVSSDCASW